MIHAERYGPYPDVDAKDFPAVLGFYELRAGLSRDEWTFTAIAWRGRAEASGA